MVTAAQQALADRLLPLGVLAPRQGDTRWPHTPLRPFMHTMPSDLQEPVARYLEACPVILPWMSYSEDEIGRRFLGYRVSKRFRVPGGPGIHSDGTYYWRNDAFLYIRVYGIGIPNTAIEHMRQQQWNAPALNRTQCIDLEAALALIDKTQ